MRNHAQAYNPRRQAENRLLGRANDSGGLDCQPLKPKHKTKGKNMKAHELIQSTAGKKRGTFATVETFKQIDAKDLADKGAILFKRSVMQLRLGHDYEAQSATKEARENGMQKRPAEWREYLSDCVCQHKEKGTVYLFGQPSGNKAVSTYTDASGRQLTKEEAEKLLKPKKTKSPALQILLKSEDIIRIS